MRNKMWAPLKLAACSLSLCSTDTSMMEPCHVRNVSDTRVVCIFKNLPRVHVSCTFQRCRVHAI